MFRQYRCRKEWCNGGVALTGHVLLTLLTSSHEEGAGQNSIRVGIPGLRKLLEREMRFVLQRKLPYKAARSWPDPRGEKSRGLRGDGGEVT